MVPWRGTPHGKRAGRITMGRNLFYFIGALPRRWKHLLLAQLISDLAVRRERIRIEVCHKDFLMPKPKRQFYPYRGRNVWFVKLDNAELFFLMKKI